MAGAKAGGVLVAPVGPRAVRLVTHLDVSAEDAEAAAVVLSRSERQTGNGCRVVPVGAVRSGGVPTSSTSLMAVSSRAAGPLPGGDTDVIRTGPSRWSPA